MSIPESYGTSNKIVQSPTTSLSISDQKPDSFHTNEKNILNAFKVMEICFSKNVRQLLLNTICLRRRLMPSCRLSWLSLWPHLISSQVATTDTFWPHFYIFGLFRSHAISQNKLSGLISPFWRHILNAAVVSFMCFMSYESWVNFWSKIIT